MTLSASCAVILRSGLAHPLTQHERGLPIGSSAAKRTPQLAFAAFGMTYREMEQGEETRRYQLRRLAAGKERL